MYYIFSAPRTVIPDVKVMRGATGPKILSGYARWDVVDRPRRTSVTTFRGSDPLRVSVPILFDGWIDNEPVEIKISNLERMMMAAGSEPPIVKINDGIAGGMPRKGIGWIIETIEWGDTQLWDFNPKGVLVRFRQDATVNVMEFVDTETAAIGSRLPGNTRGSGRTKGPKHSTHIVVDGETLASIALLEYGQRSWWKKIADANGIRDPKSIKRGQRLRLP